VAMADTAVWKTVTPTAVLHTLSLLMWPFNYLSSHVTWSAAFPVEVKVGIVWDVVPCSLGNTYLDPTSGWDSWR
jgi:hypothetical protein